ncbi:phage tail protein [Leifsonia naganoensis]|uniref:Microcystin-dependent protein n=1 Tax=Leifsonia naganoensis TaxID=150025 RepID=A0A853DPP5_9MICO|nr:tail fiber protein [Leifsonia naganoensis]NYK10237.1 microcystin-dependent protein [Leifsonia naganoensis]
MAEPFLGEIRLAAFNFPPKGWAFCNGQTLPINQNQPLFSLLGTTYGGNGQTTFQLPNLQGRVPVGFGRTYALGQQPGEEAHVLTVNELPSHSHAASVASSATVTTPTGTSYLAQPGKAAYAASGTTTMSTGSVASVGQSQPHENMAPYTVVSYIIALTGIFPSRN